MANLPITGLTQKNVDLGRTTDFFEIVDTLDPTIAPTGTNKKVTAERARQMELVESSNPIIGAQTGQFIIARATIGDITINLPSLASLGVSNQLGSPIVIKTIFVNPWNINIVSNGADPIDDGGTTLPGTPSYSFFRLLPTATTWIIF